MPVPQGDTLVVWRLDCLGRSLRHLIDVVTGLHVGAVDTDMTAGCDVPKNDPAVVVRAALDGIQVGQLEVLADDASSQAEAALAADPSLQYPQLVPATT